MSEHDGFEIDRRHGPGKVPPEVIEAMTANAQNLITEANLLRQEITHTRADRRMYRALVALAAVAISGLSWVAWTSGNTLDEIRSCTRPGAPCFDRAAQRQADVIGQPPAPINDVAVVAAACGAAHPGDIPATRKCVEEGLQR